jgi:hypothetical protein
VTRERGVKGKLVDTLTRFGGDDGGGVELGVWLQLPSLSVMLGMGMMMLLLLGVAITTGY